MRRERNHVAGGGGSILRRSSSWLGPGRTRAPARSVCGVVVPATGRLVPTSGVPPLSFVPRITPRLAGATAALALVPALALAQAPASPNQQAPLKASAPAPVEGPLKHAPQPTTPAITAADLMTRLYIFADDSMMGREAGTKGGAKGTQYIADEAKKLGLEPAGDSGGYFQNVPLVKRQLASGASITIDGTPLAIEKDFLPIPPGEYTSHFGGG